jgi:acyl carrier protein
MSVSVQTYDRGEPTMTELSGTATGASSSGFGTSEIETTVRGVLAEHGRLAVPAAELAADADLAAAGLTSHGSVNVMLGLEDAFDVEFPEALLRKSTFATVGSITEALHSLLHEDA